MTDFFFSQTAAQLQSNHDKVSSTTGALIDTDNLESNVDALDYSKYTENRFKGNQNWNVAGSTDDPLPGGTPTLYTVGAEIVAGVEVITTNADQITYVAGVLNSGNNTGILRRRYAKDAAGLITKTSQYGGIKLSDGSQLQALIDDIATNGVRITEDGSDVVVDVDLSVVTTGFRFFGLSGERGAWADVNDDESISSGYSHYLSLRKWEDVTSSRAASVTYTNDTGLPIELDIVLSATFPGTRILTINGYQFPLGIASSFNGYINHVKTIQPGDTYSYDSSFTKWSERRL